jgi:hypothetical protein
MHSKGQPLIPLKNAQIKKIAGKNINTNNPTNGVSHKIRVAPFTIIAATHTNSNNITTTNSVSDIVN